MVGVGNNSRVSARRESLARREVGASVKDEWKVLGATSQGLRKCV